MRWLTAHICAVFVGAWAIFAGVDAIVAGPVGLVGGTAKWLGGFLIVTVLAVVSLPLGLAGRFVVGTLPIAPKVGALLGGIAAGLLLIPVLHPALYPSRAIRTHTFELLGLHIIAGFLGGYTWWFVKRPETR